MRIAEVAFTACRCTRCFYTVSSNHHHKDVLWVSRAHKWQGCCLCYALAEEPREILTAVCLAPEPKCFVLSHIARSSRTRGDIPIQLHF